MEKYFHPVLPLAAIENIAIQFGAQTLAELTVKQFVNPTQMFISNRGVPAIEHKNK